MLDKIHGPCVNMEVQLSEHFIQYFNWSQAESVYPLRIMKTSSTGGEGDTVLGPNATAELELFSFYKSFVAF